jgi:uncharacterized protein
MGFVEFEWDEAKARANWKKHGVTFPQAARVFLDPQRIERRDDRNYAEERFLTVGRVDEFEILLTYTARSNVTRVISARKANRYEREEYWSSQV